MTRFSLFKYAHASAIAFTCLTCFSYYPQSFETAPETITFGSCNKHDVPQDFWRVIAETHPDLWIWGGDNVYGDSLDKKIIAHKYTAQYWNPHYRKFREQFPIIGTWDDHDFGENNSGKWYTGKVMTQRLALNFLEEPEDSARRNQKGIFTSYVFGKGNRQIKIILIDNRYHADPPGKIADLLGPDQTEWLKSELLNSTASLNLIVSGTQVLAEDQVFEKWSNFPETRNWLLKLINTHAIPGIIFLSGDRHIHEISVKDDDQTPYPLVDFTSSGMTHSYSSFTGEPNRYRAGKVYAGTGFGLIQINWDLPDPEISLQIRDMQGIVIDQYDLNLSDLKPAKK